MARYNQNRPASVGTIDPAARLAAGVVLQAVKDLHGDDPIEALDALDFVLTGNAALYLWSLGLPEDNSLIFRRVINAKAKDTGRAFAV